MDHLLRLLLFASAFFMQSGASRIGQNSPMPDNGYNKTGNWTSAKPDNTYKSGSGNEEPNHQPFTDSVNIRKFGATGDSTQDATSAFVSAIKYATANHLSIYFPRGYYYLPSLLNSQVGVITNDLVMYGTSNLNTVIKLPKQIDFTGNLYLKNLKFIGDTSQYMFNFHGSLAKKAGANLYTRTIQVDHCTFNTFKRAISAFYSDSIDANVIFSNSTISNSSFENLGVGAVMIRYKVDTLLFTHNVFSGVADQHKYSFTISVGYKGNTSASTGVRVTQNTFLNLYNPEPNEEISHTVISYAKESIFDNNKFYNCRRAMYLRGDGGQMLSNYIRNDSLHPGRLPLICKGGKGTPHITKDNTITGYYECVGLLDDLNSGWIIDHNTFLDTMVKDHYIFRCLRSGPFDFIFRNNTGKIQKNVYAISLAASAAINNFIVEGNNWDEFYTNIRGNQFISSNVAGLQNLIIRNNTLAIPSLAWTQALNRVIDSNTFYLKPFNMIGWYRTYGGKSEEASNNKFLMYPGTKAVNNNFSLMWEFDGGTTKVVHNNFYVQGANATNPFYNLKNTDSLDMEIDSFQTGNSRIITLTGNTGITSIKVNNASFLNKPTSILDYSSTATANATTDVVISNTPNAGAILIQSGNGTNMPIKSITLNNVPLYSYNPSKYPTITFAVNNFTSNLRPSKQRDWTASIKK